MTNPHTVSFFHQLIVNFAQCPTILHCIHCLQYFSRLNILLPDILTVKNDTYLFSRECSLDLAYKKKHTFSLNNSNKVVFGHVKKCVLNLLFFQMVSHKVNDIKELLVVSNIV